MIAWLLWFFLALHLFLLDGLCASASDLLPDLALVVALFCTLYARPTAQSRDQAARRRFSG